MKITFFTLLIILTCVYFSSAQIINGQDTLYGNEWISFDQPYYKLMVAEDGIYRLPYQAMETAGIPVSQVTGAQFQVFHNGEEIPIFTTTEGAFTGSDYIEFFGKKNTSELDRHLFKNPDEEMMNPLYGLFTDTSAYFLTWASGGGHKRFQTVGNDLTNVPAKEEFYMAESVQNFFSQYRKKQNSQGISSSDYGPTEGYASNFANVQSFTLTPANVFTGGGNGQLHVRYAANIGQHNQLITLNGQALVDDEFFDYQVRQLTFDIPNSTLSAPLELKFQGTVSNSDQQRVANLVLRYPRQFNFDGQAKFFFDVSASGSVKYLEIENFNGTGGNPVLYDLTNGIRIASTVENGLVKIALPPSTVNRKLALVNDVAGVTLMPALSSVNFIDYENLDAEFIILSNQKLYDDGNGNNWVQEYADYRSSQDGGGYQTVVVDVQQLYDQFGWGLNRHPLSIRNFGHYVKKHWADVQYFFVVGKGREYPNVRTAGQLGDAGSLPLLAPTFGYPGADNLLLSSNTTSTPIIPLGRLAATTPDEVRIYLKKMQDYEANASAGQTIGERQWMKEIIHLGGGNTASEQSLIRNYLQLLENTIKNNKFGGNVNPFYKTSTDPIQVSKSEQIFDRINKGVSIITFFGHSAVGTFDFNIDNPDNYNNFGKYPLMFSLGCYSGNLHTSATGISERFIFQEDKAALGFAATTGQGYISSLYYLLQRFYEQTGGDNYGESVGKILQSTIQHFDGSSIQPELIQQFTYHGDPAFTIITAQGPDYLVDASAVSIEPKVVNVRLDSFTLKFNVVNLGKNTGDSIMIRMDQELPGGEKILAALKKIQAPAFSQTLEPKLSTIGKVAVGLNRIYITVDANEEVNEYPSPSAELNNELTGTNGQKGITFFIIDNSATPVYPSDFAIVGTPEVVLRASTTDPLASVTKYILEIDTTRLFNSPLKKSTVIEQSGGLIEWKPGLAFDNERVYYWRISPDSLNPEVGFTWENRSFTYIGGSPGGWSQRHYYQFLENKLDDIRLDSTNREFEFLQDFKDFRVRNKVYNAFDPPWGYINGVRWSDFFRWDIPQSLNIVVFDTLGVIWINPNPGQFGSINNRPAPIACFPFPVESIDQRQKLIEFIENIIPDTYWVFVYTAQRNFTYDLNISQWEQDSLSLNGKNIFNVLESKGAQHVRQLKSNLVPYLFGFRKNASVLIEELANSPQGEIDVEITIPGVWFEGQMKSVLVGPAQKWNKFYQVIDATTVEDVDTTFINVYGVAADNSYERLLLEKFSESEIDLDFIDVDSFPFIRLEFYAKDAVNKSSSQLKDWTLLYEGFPDITFNPQKGFLFYKDTLPEGDLLKLETYVGSSNFLPTDSLLIRYLIRDKSGNEIKTEQTTEALTAADDLPVSFTYPTKDLSGEHQLIVQLNPDEDQPELYNFNNFLVKDFYVERDRKNPLLDVTFDGVHILDGDIVSPSPDILISLKDENPFLLLEDTSQYKLFLVYPDGSLKSVPVNSPEVTFYPAATSGENKSRIEFRPVFQESGKYALLVQATDATGNAAGGFDFKVSFEVIREAMLSNVLPYPNPFSTATRFVYTLTGETPPPYFKIQIMTVTGRIVREITQDEIGPLKIGVHRTDYAWDGTDEFGDKLANGVYLYRVIAKDAGKKEYKLYETGADTFFNKGIGKLVIIR